MLRADNNDATLIVLEYSDKIHRATLLCTVSTLLLLSMIRVSRSCITRTHTSKATVEGHKRSQVGHGTVGNFVPSSIGFSKTYDRFYNKARGGPLVAEGDQLWRHKLSGGGQVAVLQVVRGDQVWLLQLVRGDRFWGNRL